MSGPTGASPSATAGGRSEPVSGPHLAEALAALHRLGCLPRGWDGEAARPVAPAALEAVGRFVRSGVVDHASPYPHLVPTAQGGVQLEWHTQDRDLILEWEPSGAASYYVSDELSGEEAEGLVEDASDGLLARALRRLASVG